MAVLLTTVASFYDGLPARPLERELRFSDDEELAAWLAAPVLLGCPSELRKPASEREAATLRRLRFVKLGLQGSEPLPAQVLARWSPSVGRVLTFSREDEVTGPRITFDYAYLAGRHPKRMTANGTYDVFAGGAGVSLLGLVQETSVFLVMVSPDLTQHAIVLEQPPLPLAVDGVSMPVQTIHGWLQRNGPGRVFSLWRNGQGPRIHGARTLDISDFPHTDGVIDPRAWPAVEAFEGRPRTSLTEQYQEYRNDAFAKAFTVLADDEPVFFAADDPRLALRFCCYVRSIRRAQRRPVWYVLAAKGDWRVL